MKTRIDFKVGDKSYYILKPTQEQVAEAEFTYKTKYSEALRFGALTHHEAQRIIEERNLFTEEDAKESSRLMIEAANLGTALDKSDSVSEGLDIIEKIDNIRRDILILNRKRNAILDNTSEAYADEKRLHFYIVSTTFDSNGNKVFSSIEDLLNRSDEEVAVKATRFVIYMIANKGEDFRKEWPDYQWRVKNGLVNEDMEPVSELPKEFKEKLEAEKKPVKTKAIRKKKKTTRKKTSTKSS